MTESEAAVGEAGDELLAPDADAVERDASEIEPSDADVGILDEDDAVENVVVDAEEEAESYGG